MKNLDKMKKKKGEKKGKKEKIYLSLILECWPYNKVIAPSVSSYQSSTSLKNII